MSNLLASHVPQNGHPGESSVPTAILSVFVFQNLFNAFSPYITLALNLALALALLAFRHGRCTIRGHFVIVTAFAVLIWLLIITTLRGHVEMHLLLKYSRTAINITLFALIFGTELASAETFIKAINIALGFHVLLVLLQVTFPDLSYVTAPIFGFEREITILEEYTMRKLGASSSYDTASLLSVAALLFFYLQFSQGRGARFLFLSAVAFVASLLSSRAGIAVSMLIVMMIGLQALFKANLSWKVIAASGLAALSIFAYAFIYPLVLYSLGITQLQPEVGGLIYSSADYGATGTLEALTDVHLRPLHRPLADLIFGYGADPNTIGQFTDIGYVKLIYHVGIIGLLMIVFTHIYMLLVVRMRSHMFASDPNRVLIARFTFALIVIGLVFNYKSLELHSRGVGDFIFMLFLFVASWRLSHRRPQHKAYPEGPITL